MQHSFTSRSVAILVGLFSLAYLLPGAYLVSLGGSAYYAGFGGLLGVCSVCLWRLRSGALWIYACGLLLTLVWTLYESGYQFWAITARLGVPGLLGLVFLVPGLRKRLQPQVGRTTIALLASQALVLAATLHAYLVHVQNLSLATLTPPQADKTVDKSAPTDWLAYGGPRAGTRFSHAGKIHKDNVAELQVAWTYRTGVGQTFKNTPLQIDDKLYACAAGNIVIALDASTGEQLWRFDAQVSRQVLDTASYFTTTCRGVSWYEAPVDYTGECPRRLLMGTTDARLLAINADDGTSCPSFGEQGAIDLTRHMGPVPPLYYFVTSAPAMVRGNAVLGGWVIDNQETKEPSGVIRAFNAITGDFAWAWDMGRPGDPTEPTGDTVYTRGTPNVWSLFSVDVERGLVFAPLGNETPDYYGAQRHPASEEFASSVVAIDGETGALRWSFQTVHHDIWDYDVPSQPVLVDLDNAAGEPVPALVQATKRGEIFVLNRLTGEPLVPVTERLVAEGGVVEDWTAQTQPYSAIPNPLTTPLTEADMWGTTAFDQLWCRIKFKQLRYEGDFTPPSTRASIQYPGNAGGYNWGGVAIHPSEHIMVGNLLRLGNKTRLVPRAEMDAGARGAAQRGTPYGMQTQSFVSPLGIPCTQPPFGVLLAIDLRSQQMLWQRSIGTGEDFVGIPFEIGTPAVAGGSIVTATGLVFFAATMDSSIRALDLHTGAQLWRAKLPQTAQATPITYVAPQTSEQFVLITVPADERRTKPADADPQGGYIIAYKLPAN